MSKRTLFTFVLLLTAPGIAPAQQVADLKYKPPLPRPAYQAGKGPRVAIDEAHHNFHTAEGRNKPFAELLRQLAGPRQPMGMNAPGAEVMPC